MDAAEWNTLIAGLPGAHVLQTWEWAQLKSDYGWQALPQVWRDAQGKPEAAAMVMQRRFAVGRLATPFSVLYVPRGPLFDWSNVALRRRVLDDLQRLARDRRAIFIKMDPEVILGLGVPGEESEQTDAVGQAVQADLRQRGWSFSQEQVQFRNSVWLDLDSTEEVWLARMRQKTRYNLRLAERKGVRVRLGGLDDLATLYAMYAETSVRDGFVIRAESYYQQVWRSFHQAGMADFLIAEVEDQPIAAVIIFHFAGRAWYLYGMSSAEQRDKMPNYLLQWEAMRRARALNCREYDLWGAPDEFNEQDSMWGVYRFKEGLGGRVVRTLGAWDYAARPFWAAVYTRFLPRVLDWMRRKRKVETQQEVIG